MAAEPVSTLTEPNDDHVLSTVNNFIGFDQYLSPSYWLGEAAKLVCGTNPWEWVGEQLAGDWKAAAKAGSALQNMAEFNSTYADSLKDKTGPLFTENWSGNAATNAKTYFDNLEKLLRDQVAPLKDIGKQFETMTAGVLEMADGIKSAVETLTDLLIALGIELAAAAASSWTIVGGIAGGIAAAATAYRAAQVWLTAIEMHGYAWNAVQLLVGLCAGYLGALEGLKLQPLPATSYDHPGV